jgi:hypothetical protein
MKPSVRTGQKQGMLRVVSAFSVLKSDSDYSNFNFNTEKFAYHTRSQLIDQFDNSSSRVALSLD